MDNVAQSVRQTIMKLRVKRCCWLAPLTAGLMVLGYLNLTVGVVLAVGTCSGSLAPAPLLQRAQMALMEGEYNPSVCILSPVVDVAAAVLLLCGLHREDVSLLSLFSAVSACCVALSVAVYVVLCATLSAVDLIAIFCTEVYQVYVIFLVRSLIVEIRLKTSSYRHGGGGMPTSKLRKMPPIIEKVDVESGVEFRESPISERRSARADNSTVQGSHSQPQSTTETIQDVQVQVERADSPAEVVSDAITDTDTPRVADTPNMEVTALTALTATSARGPEAPCPETTPAAESSSEHKENIGNDDVTRKTRRKQCRVM